MKKFISILLVAAVAVTGYTLWQKNQAESTEDPVIPVEGITFSENLQIVDMKYDGEEKSLQYQLKNTSDIPLNYVFAYTIHQLQKYGTLKDTDLTKDMEFIEMLGILEPGKTMEDTVLFEQLNGFPEDATYYVIRQFHNESGVSETPMIMFKVHKGNVVVPSK